MSHLTNFSFEFVYKIFTEDASQPLLYHGAKKSKMTKNSNQGGGPALNFHGGFIEAESNFRGWSWTFSPKYENIGSPGVACGNSAAAWGAPSHFQRRTLSLLGKSNTGLRKMHERAAPRAACPTHEGILVLGETGRKQVFFREVTVAWAEAMIWTGLYT